MSRFQTMFRTRSTKFVLLNFQSTKSVSVSYENGEVRLKSDNGVISKKTKIDLIDGRWVQLSVVADKSEFNISIIKGVNTSWSERIYGGQDVHTLVIGGIDGCIGTSRYNSALLPFINGIKSPSANSSIQLVKSQNIHGNVQQGCHSSTICNSSICSNNGTCIDEFDKYKCNCSTGYVGPRCKAAHCIGQCFNQGICRLLNDATNWACICPNQFSGVQCESKGKCSDCQHDANCSKSTNFTCQCTPMWTGPTCAEDVNECLNGTPCDNNGTCINLKGNFKCDCLQGFYGSTCNDPSPCALNPCQNNATCHVHGGKVFCTCQDGYKGLFCSEKMVTNFPTIFDNPFLYVGIAAGGAAFLILLIGMFTPWISELIKTRSKPIQVKTETESEDMYMEILMKLPPLERLI